MSRRTLALLTIPAFLFVGAITVTGDEAVSVPIVAVKEGMTFDEAKFIIADTLQDPPVGRRPRNPGFEFLAEQTIGIRMRPNNRSGNCLVEVMGKEKVILKFYTRTEGAAKKFGAALARIKAEYAK